MQRVEKFTFHHNFMDSFSTYSVPFQLKSKCTGVESNKNGLIIAKLGKLCKNKFCGEENLSFALLPFSSLCAKFSPFLLFILQL